MDEELSKYQMILIPYLRDCGIDKRTAKSLLLAIGNKEEAGEEMLDWFLEDGEATTKDLFLKVLEVSKKYY